MDALLEGERSLASIVHDVAGNLGRIVRAEVRLAKVEVAEEMAVAVQQTSTAVKCVVAGVAIGQLALGFLFLSGVRVLEATLAPWLAALVVAVVAAVIAVPLVSTGLTRLKGVKLLPPKLVEPEDSAR